MLKQPSRVYFTGLASRQCLPLKVFEVSPQARFSSLFSAIDLRQGRLRRHWPHVLQFSSFLGKPDVYSCALLQFCSFLGQISSLFCSAVPGDSGHRIFFGENSSFLVKRDQEPPSSWWMVKSSILQSKLIFTSSVAKVWISWSWVDELKVRGRVEFNSVPHF